MKSILAGKTLTAIAVAAALGGCSSWHSMDRTEGTAVGAAGGAVAGAVVAGPVGAVVGGVGGAYAGHETTGKGGTVTTTTRTMAPSPVRRFDDSFRSAGAERPRVQRGSCRWVLRRRYSGCGPSVPADCRPAGNGRIGTAHAHSAGRFIAATASGRESPWAEVTMPQRGPRHEYDRAVRGRSFVGGASPGRVAKRFRRGCSRNVRGVQPALPAASVPSDATISAA